MIQRETDPADDVLAADWVKELETVSMCVPDGVGRLVGKRIGLDQLHIAVRNGMPMPNFHLITDIENVVMAGLQVTGPQTGFPNGILRPDLATFKQLPWDTTSALVLCDTYSTDDIAVPEAPRAILRRQVERLQQRGFTAAIATELEFYLFSNSYSDAAARGYNQLTPLYHRQGDHDVLVTGILDQFLKPVRQAMRSMGIPALSTLGEGGIGQAEMNFGHGDPIQTADHHVIFKHTVKALAEKHNLAATFMAKVAEQLPGSGCHIHLSLRDADTDQAATPDLSHPGQLSASARSFLAGVLKHSADFTVLHAPYANSYRRLQPGSWAPISATWGYDNRTVLARVLGSGDDLRFEFRLPGADINPYVSIAAVLAAGIVGLDENLPLGQPSTGDASTAGQSEISDFPQDLGQAVQRFASSSLAIRAFGPHVHSHLLSRARTEWAVATRVVTDWDRRHGFEGA